MLTDESVIALALARITRRPRSPFHSSRLERRAKSQFTNDIDARLYWLIPSFFPSPWSIFQHWITVLLTRTKHCLRSFNEVLYVGNVPLTADESGRNVEEPPSSISAFRIVLYWQAISSYNRYHS